MESIITLGKQKFPGYGGALIYFVFEDSYKKNTEFKLLNQKLNNKLNKKFEIEKFTGKKDQIITLDIDNPYELLIFVGGGKVKKFHHVDLRKSLIKAIKQALIKKQISINFFYSKELGNNYIEIGKNISLALNEANYYYDKYKSEEERKKNIKIKSFNINVPNTNYLINNLKQGIEFGKIIAEGIELTKNLVNEPASHLHPETLVKEAFKIEKESKGKISVEILDEDECQRLGMGAFLAVGQGSEKKPKFIILHYKDESTRSLNTVKSKKICLIGKSITFDSGGLSLKPSESMETMKSDMAGGATVLGVFKILAKLNQTDSNIYGILPACENMPSGKALKPGDIVKALNGKTIEVLNTDAEGRLTLADALSYAEKYIKADWIIDIATLTGACIVALGMDIAGLFGNDEDLVNRIKRIAQKEGEELWPLPLYKPYSKNLKSEMADLKNITGGKGGGAITASLFLSQFVKKAKWLHLDIAGPSFNKLATGWGVLTLFDVIKT